MNTSVLAVSYLSVIEWNMWSAAAFYDICSRCMAEEPACSLRFEYTDRGKPFFAANHHRPIEFSVAHSRGAGVIGLTCGVSVGVDIEEMRPDVHLSSLVSTLFCTGRTSRIRLSSDMASAKGVLCRLDPKGSADQSDGRRSQSAIADLRSHRHTQLPPKLIRFNDDPTAAAKWKIADLTTDHAFAAAVAVRNAQAIVQRRVFPLNSSGSSGNNAQSATHSSRPMKAAQSHCPATDTMVMLPTAAGEALSEVSRVFRTLIWAERRPALAQAGIAPLICWSFSNSMLGISWSTTPCRRCGAAGPRPG